MDVDSVPVFRRGPTRSPNYEDNLEWFTTTREQALTVPCRDCHQPINERCVTDVGVLLVKFPAHPKRISDSQKGVGE